MENRYKFDYDIKRKNVTNINFKQGDIDSSILDIVLLDNGKRIDITGETIEFRFLKFDGTVVYQDFTTGVIIIDGLKGNVECILKANTLACVGKVICEIHSEKLSKELTTPSFNFTVDSSIGENGILSTNYISLIENEMIQVRANETIRITNENARVIEHNSAMSNVEIIKTAYDNATKANLSVEVSNARQSLIKNKTFDTLGNRIDELEETEQKINYIVSESINVKSFGAVGDGITDDTVAIQNTIDYVRNEIIVSNFTIVKQVVINGGRYKVTSKITISPFVHVRTDGLVIIESYIQNDSTIHITAQETDPNFLDIMNKQQYLRSPLINGFNGGIIITSKLNRATSLATGLEIGSRTDLGVARPTARYSICDIAVTNFNVGLQENIYNHYIGTLYRCHIEANNTLVQYGITAGTVDNSGENMCFLNCVFATATYGFNWFVDGFNSNFEQCSFDYIDKLFYFQHGYTHVFVRGGHIEGIGYSNPLTWGIAISEVPINNSAPTVILDSVVSFSTKARLFRGEKLTVKCNNVKWENTIRRILDDEAWIFDDNVLTSITGLITQGAVSNLSRTLNILVNSDFYLNDTSTGDISTPISGWTIAKSGMSPIVLTQSIPISTHFTKALKITGATESTTTWATITTSNFYRVKTGDRLMLSMAVNTNSINPFNISSLVYYYDEAENLISTGENYFDKSGLVPNQWLRINKGLVSIPKNCTKVKVMFTVANFNNSTTVYVTDFHMNVG